jgi:hypothetical protein
MHVNEARGLPTYISRNGDAEELHWTVELTTSALHCSLLRSRASDGSGVLTVEPGVIPGRANEVPEFVTGSSFILLDEAMI